MRLAILTVLVTGQGGGEAMVTYIAYYSRSVLLQDRTDRTGAKSRGEVGMDVRTWEGGPKIARVATEVVESAIPRHGWLQRVELGLGRGVGGGMEMWMQCESERGQAV